MDDGKGLELSLGLACGGSSSSSKDKSGNSGDGRTATDERTNKVLNDFKNFLSAGVPQSLQRNDASKSQETFFSNLQPSASGDEARNSEHKRKCQFEEMNNQKKHESSFQDSELQEVGNKSHISITTDEGSTADNEDVAESEAEGASSRLVSHHEDGPRTPGGSGSSSQVPKEHCGKTNSGAPSFSLQSVNAGVTSTNGMRPRLHAAVPGSVPMSLGFSSVQLPVLDGKDNSWRMGGHHQAHPSPYGVRSITTSVPMQVISPSSSESARVDVRPLDQSKGQTLVTEEGSSSQVEDDATGRGQNFPLEFPAIRPGIAAKVNFGGSGSFPNLPWVSTTSPGPNGRTISGVTYKFNATQIKIVCACHGIHMSPEEFIRHATEDEQSPVTTPNMASVQSTNPTTSAKT
ncbi:ninja-family protein mc410 isoform X2 [Amaranthus tricolor]|uniref:ninja-family protein mc410 isoform X2 n=1 Tax=Amaranthus tricolor TaxID=29722 RepID=UPI002586F594|nr:ninja-family protein mc410 isoform X2 [Amaranthus tricolor]